MSDLIEIHKTVSRIEQKLDSQHEWIRDIDSRQRANEETINKAKGGWIALIGLSSAFGAIAGFLTKKF